MRWQRGPLKVVILTEMVMLTKIAKKPQNLTCKSNEEAKGPPLKVANMAKMARNRSGDFEGNVMQIWLKFAKALYRSHEFCENGNKSESLKNNWLRNDEERDFRFWSLEKRNESQKMKEGGRAKI